MYLYSFTYWQRTFAQPTRRPVRNRRSGRSASQNHCLLIKAHEGKKAALGAESFGLTVK